MYLCLGYWIRGRTTGLISVGCDWVRWIVRDATFISVWQHVNVV